MHLSPIRNLDLETSRPLHGNISYHELYGRPGRVRRQMKVNSAAKRSPLHRISLHTLQAESDVKWSDRKTPSRGRFLYSGDAARSLTAAHILISLYIEGASDITLNKMSDFSKVGSKRSTRIQFSALRRPIAYFLQFQFGSLFRCVKTLSKNTVRWTQPGTMVVLGLGSNKLPSRYANRVKRNEKYEVSAR